MPEVLVDLCLGVLDQWPVARGDQLEGESAEPLERGEIADERAGIVVDEDAALAEHRVAGETDAPEQERKVVGGVPGRRERDQRPEGVAVGDLDVGVGGRGGNRSAGPRGELRRGPAVVGVIVGDENRREAAARVDLGNERVEMGRDRGARVDQISRITTDDPTVGAGERVGPAVRGANERDVVAAQQLVFVGAAQAWALVALDAATFGRRQSSRPAGRSSRLRTVPRKSAASAP
jgi:hypothetical protein